MKFARFACSAVLFLGVAQAASAQTPTGTIGNTSLTPGVVATTAVDLARLPLDLKRIERQFQQARIREERSGLTLRYFVEVFAPAPKLVLIGPEDNVEKGPAPYGAPTHRDMLDMMTPQHFRHHGGMDILQRR